MNLFSIAAFWSITELQMPERLLGEPALRFLFADALSLCETLGVLSDPSRFSRMQLQVVGVCSEEIADLLCATYQCRPTNST